MNEAQLYEHNAYITLTYEEDDRFNRDELCYSDYQAFMRRLRKHFARLKQKAIATREGLKKPRRLKKSEIPKIRFYMSGEFGDRNGRPHFHAILFNVEFTDKIYLKKNASGAKLYTSATLEKLWGKGFTSIGDVTFQSAAYVARYVMKKVTGKGKTDANAETDPETGEIKLKQPLCQMSRKPGIGRPWIEKFKTDVYPHGKQVVNGLEVRPPKFYDKYYKTKNPKLYRAMIQQRQQEVNHQDNTNDRIEAKEKVKQAQLDQLKRKL